MGSRFFAYWVEITGTAVVLTLIYWLGPWSDRIVSHPSTPSIHGPPRMAREIFHHWCIDRDRHAEIGSTKRLADVRSALNGNGSTPLSELSAFFMNLGSFEQPFHRIRFMIFRLCFHQRFL